ncbi:hypothetical protein BT63DRAFT_146058 [Microthyrium microscopicum]|uniref:Uncharacterized protein n=1 Tax=Microthyrium microscopicum TaxID=703497 RepID=A0A6A6ULH2_9PEZI|nr:hypothetical protein BT63DRAFT_146058 [Microthyrium microscopicum]
MAPVPKYSTLGPGRLVNIVLKADQPTGKLTTGVIADILTKGDHPRGIKVRLQTGAVGRVQSLNTGDNPNVLVQNSLDARHNLTSPYKFQEDFRKTEAPATASSSLSDYIKAPSRNQKKKNKKNAASAPETEFSVPISPPHQKLAVGTDGKKEDMSDQAHLENEFPATDSALIAAILSDYGSVSEARTVLASLS